MGEIRLISTGGTIASVRDPDTGAVRTAVSGEELLSNLGGIDVRHDVTVEEFSAINSWDMTPSMMQELAGSLTEFLDRSDSVGAVVTHGTDTLEETAYFLHLTVSSDKPVVVTGAMRNHSDPGFDGHQNLYHSLVVAASRANPAGGTLVVMNDEIHSPRWVTKSHTTKLETFVSANAGPVGYLNDDVPVFLQSPPGGDMYSTTSVNPVGEIEVPLIKTAAGVGPVSLQSALDRDPDGLVIEGSGSGNVPSAFLDGIERASEEDVPVVVVSRCWRGAAVPVYGNPGGGKTLRERGVVHAPWLNGQKARIQLIVHLASVDQDRDLKDAFGDPRESMV